MPVNDVDSDQSFIEQPNMRLQSIAILYVSISQLDTA